LASNVLSLLKIVEYSWLYLLEKKCSLVYSDKEVTRTLGSRFDNEKGKNVFC